jgi:hypothetical protein
MLSVVVEDSRIQSLTSRQTLELQALQREMTMFTIDGEGQQYEHFWLIMVVAKQLSARMKRSVTIQQNGRIIKLLRY